MVLEEKIKELYYMCRDNDFSVERATELINVIDVNEPFNDPCWNKSLTTFLIQACMYTNLKMARVLLENGADPNYVLYAVVEGDDDFRLLEYRSRFLILLVAYGGKNEYYQPQILKPFDKNNMKQYEFVRFPVGRYGCVSVDEIVDKNYEVVARIPDRAE